MKKKKSKRNKRKNKSMWDMMQSMSQDFPAQEKRIEKKKKLLEEHGVDVDISHIKKPEPPGKDVNRKGSMWEIMQSMDNGFAAHKEYLDALEKVYDKAICEILGPEYINNRINLQSTKAK